MHVRSFNLRVNKGRNTQQLLLLMLLSVGLCEKVSTQYNHDSFNIILPRLVLN